MFPVLFSIGPLTVYTFGVFALLAFFFGSFVVWKRGKEANLIEEEIFDSIVIISITGLLSARAAYIVLNFERFGFSFLNWLSYIRLPGFTFMGGLVGGLVVLLVVCRNKRWGFFDVADIGVTGLSLAQAIGWLGAFFSGLGVGKEVGRFGLLFPGFEDPRFPAQIIWMLGFVLIFIFLWRVEERYRTFEWYRGKRTVALTGFLLFSYFVGLGVLKLLVASVYEPRVYWFRISAEVLVALAIVMVGMIGLYLRSGREFSEDRGSVIGILVGSGYRGVVWFKQRLRRVRRKLPANKRSIH
jgi:phosphatidylglycerol:prolipoprotein diacylglycerol transferase